MIDGGLREPWPGEVADAAKRFQQGDLIEDPPLVYTAHLAFPVWALSRDESEAAARDGTSPAAEDELEHLAVADGPRYGVLTSQTCDIAEDRPEPVQPWVQVCPVYECAADAKLVERDYVYPLPSFAADEGKIWVADLRIECALEKGALVGRQPIDPFAGAEDARIDFGDAVGRRRARAAFAETVHVFVNQTLRSHRDATRNVARRVKKRLYKLMLAVEEGTRLDPRSVQLHVVVTAAGPDVDDEADAKAREELEEWFGRWWDTATEVAASHGVTLLRTRFHSSDSMDVALYDRLIEMRSPLS